MYEFLMLFLAVSAGFFMENLREHNVENDRAEILAQSLNNDLIKDSIALNDAINFSKFKGISIDSGIYNLHLPKKQWNDTVIYRSVSIAARVLPFDRTQGTYEQLKSSGSLRYFKQPLVNLMNAYDVQAKKVLAREEIDTRFILDQLFPTLIKNINSEVISDMVFDQAISHELYFNNTDKANCNELINYLTVTKNLRFRSNGAYLKLKSIGIELLKELKKEFLHN